MRQQETKSSLRQCASKKQNPPCGNARNKILFAAMRQEETILLLAMCQQETNPPRGNAQLPVKNLYFQNFPRRVEVPKTCLLRTLDYYTQNTNGNLFFVQQIQLCPCRGNRPPLVMLTLFQNLRSCPLFPSFLRFRLDVLYNQD